MKRYVSVIAPFLLLMSVNVFAQGLAKEEAEGREPATKFERFLARKCALIVKDLYEIGILSGQYGTKAHVRTAALYKPGGISEGTDQGAFLQVNQWSSDASLFFDVSKLSAVRDLASKAAEKLTALGAKR